jgi:ADP-heptose:LPS heptosyltransferase
MHIIETTGPITIARQLTLPAGAYLADDTNAGQWLSKHADRARIIGRPPLPPWTPEAKRLCVVRPGGLGDLIMLTAILRTLAQRYPQQRIEVSTYPWNAVVLEGLPYVHTVVPYPLPIESTFEYDAVVALENVLEYDPTPSSTAALDAMLRRFPGLELNTIERRPSYALRDDEVTAALTHWPRPETSGGVVVGLQVQASAKCRTYPRNAELIERLVARGHGVRLFNEPGRRNLVHEWGNQVHDLGAGEPNGRAPNVRESIALMKDCAVVIAPDSSLVHAAGALGVPCVGLYGSFYGPTRMADYPSVSYLQGRAECAPCCWHSRGGHWPAQGECRTAQHCTALAQLEPARIVRLAEIAAERKHSP